jgi:hypothetical protein
LPGGGGVTRGLWMPPPSLRKGYRYPMEIISHCMRLYHRFPLCV